MTKGFLSEVLVASGVYLISSSTALSAVFITLGCLGGITRFVVSFNSAIKKEQLYETANTFINKIIEKPVCSVDFSSFGQGSEEIH